MIVIVFPVSLVITKLNDSNSVPNVISNNKTK